MTDNPLNNDQEEFRLLSLLNDAIDFAIYRVALDPGAPNGGRVVMVSPSMKEMVGILDPWRFEHWFDNMHPDDLPRALEANHRSWTEGARYDQAVRVYNAQKARWIWVRTISTPTFDENGKLSHFTGVVIDITEQKQAEAELCYRLAFENLVLSLSTRFINLSPAEIDPALGTALEAIGQFTDVDRAYLFVFSADLRQMSCTHEWCAPGVSPHIQRLQSLDVQALAWSNHRLLNGEVLHIPHVADLPPEAEAEKQEFQSQDIVSLLSVPMVHQGRVLGLLGFDSVRAEKSWPSETVGLLQVVSSIFVNALENKRAQEALKKAHNELEQRVIQRTHALEQVNASLQVEVRQRQQAEESLQISQALYSEVFDNSPLQIFVVEVLPDGRFRVLRTNPAHEKSSGLAPDQIWGKTIEELVIPEVAQSITQHYRDCIAASRPIEYEEQGPSPYWNLERIRTFRTTLGPVFDQQGQVVRLIGSSEDITEQKQAEGIIMERAREEAVVNERSRLARELHDAVTQTLFSTTLTAEVLPRLWERSPDEGRKKLEELRELTRGALAEMRTLLVELRPDALVEAELTDLLRHLSNAFIARARVPVELSLEGRCELPLDAKIAFYRVAQEALNNIARHAEASQVSLSLVCQPGHAALRVCDDGLGFDSARVLHADHYGLRIMHERAEQVGAQIFIHSQPGQGTQIDLRHVFNRNGS